MRSNLDDERAKERARHKRPLVVSLYINPKKSAAAELLKKLKAEKEQDDGKPADR